MRSTSAHFRAFALGASESKEPEAGRALIKFLTSPAASATIIKSGLEPIAAGGTN